MYNEEGETIWERSLDAFGKVQEGSHKGCPFMYQGQYYDEEIELAYNRFRYYDPEEGRYISKDPIGLKSGQHNFYSYVYDPNKWLDQKGLNGVPVLPPSRIVHENGVIVEHYYPNDHPPAHIHVYEEGKKSRATKIGENGNPLKNQRDLTAKEAKVVDRNKKEIQKSARKIRHWLGVEIHGDAYFQQKQKLREERRKKQTYKK